MEGDCNVYAHSSLWMRPTRPDRYNAKMSIFPGIFQVHLSLKSPQDLLSKLYHPEDPLIIFFLKFHPTLKQQMQEFYKFKDIIFT